MNTRSSLSSLLPLLLALSISTSAAAGEKADREQLLARAQTLYWIGLADQGNVKAFERGLELVEEARNRPSAGTGLAPELKALKADLTAQLEIAKGTFYGAYPLVRVLGPVLVGPIGPPGRYDTNRSPAVTAATTAAAKLADGVVAEWKAHPQLHAVLRGVPLRDATDEEETAHRAAMSHVRYQLARHPRFAVHPPAELARLPSELLAPVERSELLAAIQQDDELEDGHREALLRALKVRNLLVVTVRRIGGPSPENVFFYGVEGRLYQRDTPSVARSIGAKAITEDRTDAWFQVLFAQFGFLALALATGLLFRRPIRGGWLGTSGLLLAAGGFVVARVLAAGLAALVLTIAPEPRDPLDASRWWPALAGIALVLGPVAVIRLLLPRLAAMRAVPHPEGNLGFVGGASGIGTAAFLAGPLVFLDGSFAVGLIVPVVIACWALGYLLGAALDSLGKTPAWVAGVAVVLAAFAGTAFCLVEPVWLWSTAALCGVAAAPFVARYRDVARSPGARVATEGEAPELEAPAGVNLTRDPAFQPLASFADTQDRLRGVGDGRTRWLGLWGRAGVGKTTTARMLVEGLSGRFGEEVVVLRGTCPPESETETPVPYQPFREALAGHYSIDLLADRTAQLGKLDVALREAVSSVFPFGQLLFPAGTDDGEVASSQREIASCIQHSLRALLARGKIVLLVIDDLHTADPATREILQEVHREFPPGGDARLGVLLTSRDPGVYEALGISETILELPEPDAEERARILADGLGIEPASAAHIVAQVGTATGERGSLIWLLEVVSHLARLQAFGRGPEGLRLMGEYAEGNALPIPEDLHEILRTQFLSHPQYRRVLECAACMGPRFSLTVLADGLEMSRLDLLDLLREIEIETGLIHDVMEDDDFFSFRSPLMLEVVRREVRVKGHGPAAHDVPQIIREYHARVARAIEQRNGGEGAEVFDLARHHYAAGAVHGRAGRDWCLRAATAARTSYDLEGARRYIDMARECAEVAGGADLVDDAELLIDCDLAFFGATDPAEVAAAGLAYLTERDDAPLHLLRAVARTCYLARNNEDTVRLGQEIVARAETPEDIAAGHHYVGLGKRFLSQDPTEARQQMRTALEILGENPDTGVPARRLEAQICNSLAETYAYGSDDDRAEALTLFETAAKLRENGEVGDLAGQARTHGGLGRLFYFAPEPDRDRAREHFRKDLEISEEIGDRKGQCQMQSFLGGCDRDDGRLESALQHYRASFKLAESRLDHVFAAAGRLECLGKLGSSTTELDATGEELVELTEEAGLPAFAWKEVRRALENMASREREWWDTLRARAEAALETAGG